MNMKKRAYALLLASLFALGAFLTAPVAAQANGPFPPGNELQVQNTGYSNANLWVCGTGNFSGDPCIQVLPGNTAWSSTSWTPSHAPVYVGAAANYRLIDLTNGWTSNWQYINRSSVYQQIPVSNMFAFFGCQRIVKPCLIQVVHDDSR